jgi:CheY-like chemotaxis protein
VIFERMADLGEIAFAQEVRGDRNTAATGLILLVAPGANVNEERLRNAGIRACIAKPVSQSELFDALTITMASDALGHQASPKSTQPIRAVAPPVRVSEEMRRSVRVLLVEDNFLNMKLTLSQLQKLGYHADSAANGKEAVDAVGAHDHDIILMDCQMPIIAMTANALGGDREKCLSAGMDDYLAKPTKQDELEIALARYFA